MRFSVDAHVIGRKLTGNEVYIRNLLDAFGGLDGDSEFFVYLSLPDTFPSVPARFQKRLVSGNPFVRLGLDLPRCLMTDGPDLLHVQYTAPLGCRVPVVVSVHDVSFLEHPEWFPFLRSLQLRYTVSRTIRTAARIITMSEFSRRAIARNYGLDEAGIAVVPAAVSPLFHPMSREAAAAFVSRRFGVNAPIVLCVGDLQPRKNHLRLIEAFAAMLAAHPELPHHLVLTGKDTWYGGRVRAAAERSSVRPRIHFTGFVDDAELQYLYGACELFVFPSLYEGFGFPVLEAMACGRAVACSNVTALPEVADGAAAFFHPESPEEIARAMRDVLLDRALRTRLERLGQVNAARFSWRRTGAQTLAVYRSVAEEGSRRTHRRVKAAPAVGA